MDLDERFQDAYATLERLKDELLHAREAAEEDASTWGGWLVRYNQRLRSERVRLAILLRPPPEADPRLGPLYDAGIALRDLADALNRAVQGLQSDVAMRRLALETALRRVRDALGTG